MKFDTELSDARNLNNRVEAANTFSGLVFIV